MIDGAHVLTPGVLRFGMQALDTYAPAVVATQQWYVGPGQQGDAQQAGYDQRVEDRLFDGIDWPVDGYRLFEIGHFIGDRDWFDGIVESNCLFVPRKLLEQLGGFDESFSMPGGGYANLDLFERLALSPGHHARRASWGRARSTSSTAGRRRTSPTRPLAASGSSRTGSTSRRSAVGRSSASTGPFTTSARWPPRPPGAHGRGGCSSSVSTPCGTPPRPTDRPCRPPTR